MIISKTPLRISFAGGGTDLKSFYQKGFGAVVSTAIDKYIYITANKKFDDRLRVGYSKIEVVDDVEKIEHNLVREALKLTGNTKGLDVVYMSDMLPAQEASGLGSSSSLIVGTLNALYALKGEHSSADKLAQEACDIEIDKLSRPIGRQDQYAAAFGGFNYIQFNSDGTVFVSPIVCKPETKEKLKKNLLMFYTGLKNSSTDNVLTEQNNKTETNLQSLNKMAELARELKNYLEQNNLDCFGEILHQGWMLKQNLANGITNQEINNYYEKARSAGAKGGKILGSGGGGCLLFYCEQDKQDDVRKALANLKEVNFNFEPQGSKIIYVG